ncbi:MAG: DUF3443 family protein [Thermodesulfobacteriota bacterium]
MKSISKFFLLLIFTLATVCGGVSRGDAAPKKLVSIAVAPSNPSIVLGTTEQFRATGTYSDSSTRNLTTSVTWSSSAGSVAIISNARRSKGKATSGAGGTTTIAARLRRVSGSTTLTVITLVSIAVQPASPSIVLGTTEQFTATGTYSDNSTRNLTASVIWSSSAKSVATISNTAGSKGKATSVAAGTTTIRATSMNISGSTTLTVTPATLVSIAVASSNPSIVLGTTEQFTAIGTYSDSSTQNLTASVTWSSSAKSVATISNAAGSKGKATSGAAGTTTITAASGNISGSTTLTVIPKGSEANNVLPITVSGSLCSTDSYLNKPCVSVTVCTPGTSTCQAINDILLDTGSFGLRIFKQVLTVPLVQATDGSGSLAECVQFGDGSSNWGPVQIASIILGNEPAIQVPIQVIDSTFGTLPAACRNADQTPAAAGFNGILGVGLFTQDCGLVCASSARNGMYYSCNGSICMRTSVPLSNQVQNPVALLPQDNNGVIVQLPSIPGDGSPSVNGNLVLGIDTQSNNVPSGVTTYAANQVGEITTLLKGKFYSSFIDSGSNGLFFTPPLTSPIPNCPSPDSVWFCPSSTTTLSATNRGASGSPSGVVSFQIGNFMSLIDSPNNVFSDIGGNAGVGGFDWGLPFFFGRNIYFGFEGSSSSLGSGPCFAY